MKYWFSILGFLAASGFLFSQNSCETALPIDDVLGNCFSVDFNSATYESFNTSCSNDSSTFNTWYSFFAEGPEIYVDATHSAGADVIISVIRFTSGDCDPVKYNVEACEINSVNLADALTVGNQYFVILNVDDNVAGDIEFCVINPDITPPPSNDKPCNAYSILLDSTCQVGTTVHAEQDIDTFQCSPEFTNEVWYEFTLSEGLFFGVEVFLTNISMTGDVRVALVEFGNQNCENEYLLKQQYCGPADGFLFDYVSLEQDKQYYIAVATSPESQGEFSLCLKEMEALAHTDPCQAIEVIPNDACINFDTYYSLFEYDLPNCDFTNQKIWYKFYTGTELNEISLQLDKIGDQENVFLGLGYYQGNWCENQFHWVDTYCGDVANAKFSAEDLMPYQVYHIVVGTNFGFTGEFDLCINGDYNSPFTNDGPCQAYNIDNISGCVGGSSEYGSLHVEDTICFDFSPIKKTWYKVELDRFDGDIDIAFSALTLTPLHKIELGFFEEGCLDSFIVVADYCGLLQESSTSYAFPDSISFAYITVNLPDDQVYNYSICVNARPIAETCLPNDFCQESEDLGEIVMTDQTCFVACTFGSTVENSTEHYTSKYNTNWFNFKTGASVKEIELHFTNGTTPAFFIGLTADISCEAQSFSQSKYIQLTSQASVRLDVIPNTDYVVAIAAIDEIGGSVDICIEGKEENTCATIDRLVVQAASLGSPLEGPFQEGENVSFCYTIDAFSVVSESSCQWLQGILPSFGGSWAESSFDESGKPIISTSIIPLASNVEWGWRDDAHSRLDNTFRRLSNSSRGLLDICHVYEDNCSGVALEEGDLLPAGWYAWNFSQGQMHPDSTYGDGVSCEGNNGSWQVCFDLLVGTASDSTDLSISFHNLADGEIGLVGEADTSCMEDMPLSEQFFIDCMDNPLDSVLHVLTCSENTTLVELPEDQFFFWVSTGHDRINGITNGSGNQFELTLSHEEGTIQNVEYILKAYNESGCHLANYAISVDVYPSLDIAREELFTICQTDSVSMSQVIDLEAQIIGDFAVNWESSSVEDLNNAYWKSNKAETIPYSVISEAGCYFRDTVMIHVEDVLVGDFIEDFIACRGDEVSLVDVIPLDSIINDNFTVNWDYGDLEDVPSVDTSFELTSSIPFTLEGESGCVYSDTLSIIVPYVFINVLGRDEYCTTDTVSISAGYQFDEPHTKFWILPGQDTILASGLSRPASIFETGINSLEFQLFTKEGCPFYDYDTITVYDFPDFTFNQDSQFLGVCPYDSLELNLTVSPNLFDVVWTTPFGITNAQDLTINQAGWYSVVAGFENENVSCINRDSFHLEIYPAVETEFNFDPIVCLGDSSLIQSIDPNYMFLWSTGDFSSEVKLPAGEYAVTVSNGLGCVSLFDIEIEEQALPTPNFDFDESICEGDSTYITGDDSSLSYEWSTEEDSETILTYGGEYSVTVTDNEMCVDSFDFAIETVAYPEAAFSYELVNDSLYLFNNSSEAESCAWQINDEILEFNGDTLLILPEGDYMISLACANGDCEDSQVESISVVLVGLANVEILDWKLYPNPSNGQFVIHFDDEVKLEEVIVLDIYGSKVFTEKYNFLTKKEELSLNLVSGIYLLQIKTNAGESTRRLVIKN